MITIKKINVTNKFSIKFVNITFEIEDTYEDLSKYRFDLYKADTEFEDFKLAYSNIQDFECNDYNVSIQNPEVGYHYKIKITNTETGESCFSDTASLVTAREDEYTFFFDYIYNTSKCQKELISTMHLTITIFLIQTQQQRATVKKKMTQMNIYFLI